MTPISITSAELRSNLSESLDSVAKGNVVIVKRRGKPDVSLVDSELMEDFVASHNPRLIKKVAKARAEKKEYSFDEVFGDIL